MKMNDDDTSEKTTSKKYHRQGDETKRGQMRKNNTISITTCDQDLVNMQPFQHSDITGYDARGASGEGGIPSAFNNVTNYHLVEKAVEINLVLDEPEIDLWRLRELALTEGGLVNDAIRRRAWPKLVGLHNQFWDDDEFELTSTRKRIRNIDNENRNKVGTCTNLRPKNKTNQQTLSSSSPITKSRTIDTPIRDNTTKKTSRTNSLQSHDDAYPNDDSDAGSQYNASDTNSTDVGSNSSNRSVSIIVRSLDFVQIELDCKRCTWHLLTGSQRLQRLQMENKRHSKIAKLIKRKQRRLSNLINYTLSKSYDDDNVDSSRDTIFEGGTESNTPDQKDFMNGGHRPAHEEKSTGGSEHNRHGNPCQRYYQGYHDVACIFMSTLSGISKLNSNLKSSDHRHPSYYLRSSSHHELGVEDLARASNLELSAAVLYQLSRSHFPDYLKSNFWDLQTIMRLTVNPLLSFFDNTVYKHFIACEMELPYFALSWVLTWFSHEIRDTELVKRIFDFFIVSHPLMPIYVSVAMILHPYNREDVLSTDCDFSELHHLLSTLPRNSSMVGWKYRPGDGYVSDDGEEDEDDHGDCIGMGPAKNVDDSSVSIDADSFVLINETWAGAQQKTESISVVSSSLSSNTEIRVPFQDLIDLAIRYMEQVPPRLLIRLAVSHYTSEQLHEILEPLAEQNQIPLPPVAGLSKDPEATITACMVTSRMFDSPSWSRIPKCYSDKVLKERSYAITKEDSEEHLAHGNNTPPIERLRQRKRDIEKSKIHPVVCSVGLASSKDKASYNNPYFDVDAATDEDLGKYLESKSALAKIAAGFSSDDELEKRRHNKSSISISMGVGVALAVVIVAVIAGIVIQQNYQRKRITRNNIVKPEGSTRNVDSCEITDYTQVTGVPASIIYNSDSLATVRSRSEFIENIASCGAQSVVDENGDTVLSAVDEIGATCGALSVVDEKKTITRCIEKRCLLVDKNSVGRKRSKECQKLESSIMEDELLPVCTDPKEDILIKNHDRKSRKIELAIGSRQTQKLSIQVADSPVSIAMRNFIKHLTRNPVARKLAQIKSTQVSVHVRDLMHNALVQNLGAVRRKDTSSE